MPMSIESERVGDTPAHGLARSMDLPECGGSRPELAGVSRPSRRRDWKRANRDDVEHRAPAKRRLQSGRPRSRTLLSCDEDLIMGEGPADHRVRSRLGRDGMRVTGRSSNGLDQFRADAQGKIGLSGEMVRTFLQAVVTTRRGTRTGRSSSTRAATG